MAKLIYAAITSLDGYVEDTEGKFDWVNANSLGSPGLFPIDPRAPVARSRGARCRCP
jgi:hypothetical protein